MLLGRPRWWLADAEPDQRAQPHPELDVPGQDGHLRGSFGICLVSGWRAAPARRRRGSGQRPRRCRVRPAPSCRGGTRWPSPRPRGAQRPPARTPGRCAGRAAAARRSRGPGPPPRPRLAGRDHPVDQAHRQRLGGGDRPAGQDQVQRPAQADQRGAAAPCRRRSAAPPTGGRTRPSTASSSATRRSHHSASSRPPGHGVPGDRGDHRLGQPHPGRPHRPVAVRRGPVAVRAADRLEVGTGAERPARAPQHGHVGSRRRRRTRGTRSARAAAVGPSTALRTLGRSRMTVVTRPSRSTRTVIDALRSALLFVMVAPTHESLLSWLAPTTLNGRASEGRRPGPVRYGEGGRAKASGPDWGEGGRLRRRRLADRPTSG